jgi:hypothetical protein
MPDRRDRPGGFGCWLRNRLREAPGGRVDELATSWCERAAMTRRASTGLSRRAWPVLLMLLAGGHLSPVAHGQAIQRGSGGHVPVVVGIDALGLVEGWAAGDIGRESRSTARPPADLRQLLFACPRAFSLQVTVEGTGAGAAGRQPGNGFSCRAGEALFAVREGLVCARRPALPPSAPGATGRSEIVIEDGPHEVLITGECVGPLGAIVPAWISADLGGVPPLLPPDCAGGRSSATFRGQLTAGGC